MEKFTYVFSARKFAEFVEQCKQAGMNDFNDTELKKYGYYFYNMVDKSFYWRKWK